jgi:hypothetical protein
MREAIEEGIVPQRAGKFRMSPFLSVTLTLGLGTTMEPTVCQAPMLHARQYYAVCREIQGTISPDV